MWRSTSNRAERALFDRWMAAYTSDLSDGPLGERVLKARPPQGVEGCYDTSTPPAFIAEPLVFTHQPTTACSQLYPVYSNVRARAGGPLAADVLKCQLKPVDPADYRVAFSTAELARLTAIFPEGVCDWSRPGVNQVPVVTWASVGPSPKNRLD